MASGPVLPIEDKQVSVDIDDLHISLHDEQEDTQKKAFTCWINSKLAKHTPPSVVSDLFTDIKQGHVLLDLLEVLSGQQLPRDKGTNTFQCRINIEHALTFLQKRSIKLINIHVNDVIDGNPSIILGLIWRIILHFHIEKLAQTIACNYNQPSLESVTAADSSPTSSPPAKKSSKIRARWHMSAEKALLSWAQAQCATDKSVRVTDFKTSWRNGMAFLAVIHALRPDLIDMESVKHRSNKDNLSEAFRIAERELKIPKLLEPEDVDVVNPDEKSIMTYVAQFLQYSKNESETRQKAQEKMKEATVWLAQQEKELQNVLEDSESKTYSEKYERLLSYLESFTEGKKPFLDVLSVKRNPNEDQQQLNQDEQQLKAAWDDLNSKINLWKTELDDVLPSPLHQTEAWLQETEKLIHGDLPASQDYFETMTQLQEKMTLFKSLVDKSDFYLNTLLAFENRVGNRDETHLPLVPPSKLEEMKRRINNVLGIKYIPLLEFHYYTCSVLCLLKEVKSKLDIWDIKYGTKESVELLLEDWQKFMEEKEFLAHLESSFKKCEESYKNLATECQDIKEQYKTVKQNVCLCRKSIHNVKSTLQNVLKFWATYVENLCLLKACFEETKKEHIKEVPHETLSQWNVAHATLNEAGDFLIKVSNDEVGASVSKELKRLNKRWRKFIPKTYLEMNLPLVKTQAQPILDNSDNTHLSEGKNPMVDFSTALPLECPESQNQNIKVNLVKSVTALKNSAEVSPDLDVRWKVENSQKELESSISKAEQLLRQRESQSELISKYKEAVAIFNNKSLTHYLKAVEELKSNASEAVRQSLEETSGELYARWKTIHHDMFLYIQQLKVDIEKGKLSENISKLEKQINKEKKLRRRGRPKSLNKEHEACFYEEGSLSQLDHHMQTLRELCEDLPSQKSQQEVRRMLRDYEQKIERLRKSASEIQATLQPMVGGTSKHKEATNASENGGRNAHGEVESAKSDHQLSNEKSMEFEMFDQESELKPEQEENMENYEEDHNLPKNNLLDRCEKHKETLALHLKNNKFRISSDFPINIERSSTCLQDKLTELQILKTETETCWKEFETSSLKSEELVSDTCKSLLVKTRDQLKRKQRMFQKTLNARISSLETALQIVLPLEEESLLLCGSDLVPHEMIIQELHLTNADNIHQNLRNIQDSIAKQIEICNNLGQSDNFVLKELDPLDVRATQNIIMKHRMQLEEKNNQVQLTEEGLKALEDFLSSLRTAENSLKPVTASDTKVVRESTLTVENQEREIHLMKDKARDLDARLKMLRIRIKDAQLTEDVLCEKLLNTLSKKFFDIHDSGSPEDPSGEEILETCISKNNELLKNILDVSNELSKISLKDPTAPAVKQRKKSLTRLDKELDDYEEEKKHLEAMINSLPQFKDGREKALSQQFQNTALLWENSKVSVTECLDQCERTLALLKQYQILKNILTTLIQKEENVISLQASYVGKEYLKKRIAEIEIVKEEFNEHLDVVDNISQICKNLQFHLNKMKTFEDPPFEKEANIIVDRWLDINEKTEDYCENLGLALALWEKLFNVKDVIDEWTENVLEKVKLSELTEEEREKLKGDLQIYEQKSLEFSEKVAKIQLLLQSNEVPLELQVMKTFILKKIESVKNYLMGEINSSALSGSTAELQEDLDQAKTQIGMTESLLKALSPSDSLEIFTKLEEIQQQILQQKHSMILLENQIGCLTPELSELKKQYESVRDLFNTKKSVLQDHFSKLLNDQCKNFNDWFSNIKMNLQDCFDSSETKSNIEQKLQKLSEFLTLEGKGSEIQQVGTVLNRVKKHLPKAQVKELNSWIVSEEIELAKMESICQARAKELNDYLQQLLRLQDDHRNLSKWLANQEEKWKEMEELGEKTDLFYQVLDRKREQFESLAQLNNSLKESGITEEEVIAESTHLVDRYQALLRQLCEIEDEDKLTPAESQSFDDLTHDVIQWITEIKESLMVLNSSEGKMPLEERIQKIKEIILLKPEGDAKIQTIMKQAEGSHTLLVPQILTDFKDQWDNTLHLANTYLSHQEKLLLEGEKYLQSKEDLRLMLTELKKKQEMGFALQPGLPEKEAQLKIYRKFLKKAQDLTSLLKELKAQGKYLLECTKNSNFSEEPWLEIKRLHESLLQQLQDSVEKLEGHVKEHHSYQVYITELNTALDDFSKEFLILSDKPLDQIAPEEKLQKLQELENRLNLQDDTLKRILVLAESINPNTSSAGQKIIKDDIKSLKDKQKDLENKLQSAKQEMRKYLNSILESKSSKAKEEKFALPSCEKPVTSDIQESSQELAAVEKLEKGWGINKNSAVEKVLSKQLSLDVQESMKNTEDEQKVNELQNQPLELDVMFRNEQLKEIEELYMRLEAQKSTIERLEPTEYLNKTETSALVLHNIRSPVHHLDTMLHRVMTLKKNKESQYHLLEDFQEHLTAVESSTRALLTEKESLKVGPMDSVTYLEKIKKFLAFIDKEKCSLRKIKIDWQHLSSCLSDLDKKLLEDQIKQLEYSGEQLEQLVQRKYSQQVVEYNEFTFLMNTIQDLEVSLQQLQQHLRLKLDSPEKQAGDQSLVTLVTELQTVHHRFSVLKRQADLQMKRTWGGKEKMILEDAMSNLQKQLDVLQPLSREMENQIDKCQVRSNMKKMLLWVKNLLSELVPPVFHPPDDVLSQIRKCKVMHDDILKKQQAVESLALEVKDNIPKLTAHESDDLNSHLQDLQNHYQMLVLKSTQRSQQLESKLEERSRFVAEIGKVQLSLQGNEALIIPPMETASTEADLERQHVTLMASQQKLEEMESVISTYFQEAANIYKDLTVFERVFLDDQLKNLKARVHRTQRFIQSKCEDVEHKMNCCKEFHVKASVLEKEVDNIQHNELLLRQKVNPDEKEELCHLKEQLTGVESSILQMLKFKELSDCIKLDLDYSQFDHLRSQLLEKEHELEEKMKHLDTFVVEYDKYQASLRKLRAVNLQIKQRIEATLEALNTSPEGSLSNAQCLNQKIEKALCLHHEITKELSENKTFDDSFKEKEIQQIKQYEEESNRLHKVLQNAVLECQPKEVGEKNFRDKLENSLHVLNQIDSQLQKPVCIHLEIEHIEDEKDNCEVLQKQVQAEMQNVKAVTLGNKREENSSEASEVEIKLHNIEDLHTQLNTSIDLRKSVLNDALENMTCYEDAVTRAKGIITMLEAVLASLRVDLENPEESLARPRWMHRELESTIADIQDRTEKLGAISSPEAKLLHQCTTQDLLSKNSALREVLSLKEAEIDRCLENYKCYRKTKEKLCTDLSQMETVLGQSLFPLPVSYKEALERAEQSKALVSNLMSIKEDFMKLRQVLRHLRPMCTENDGTCLLKTVSALWDKWLRLLNFAREWEMWCDELKQEWKLINEEIEREVIILDNLQEELPEISKTKEAATNEELCELQDCFCQYEENVEKQQLVFSLLLQRVEGIQHAPENFGAIPAIQEITSMQERCHKLFQKAQKNKELLQNEIQERHSITEEIVNLKDLFQQTLASVVNLELQGHPERAEQFEELQSLLKKGKLTFGNIMEKLRIKYSEMYSIVPAEIEHQVEECRKALEDVDEKISSEVLKSSPSYAMSRKIDEINDGLLNVEKMLQQKSKNIDEAQQVQKEMWDELDLWHSKLNELDSEVHDIVEQDPGQAQEWMDKLMVPFQQYQQVSQRAESRTSQLNKAILKMEEYHDLLKSTEIWIKNTGRLLDNPAADYDSSKMLSQRASTLQMALEDSEQKHNLLHSMFTDLEDLSVIFETDDLAQSIQELSHQVADLQQKLMESLPQIQQMADDVVAIENEVKSIEKRVSKIKTILLSKEIFDFSPEEHLKHGEVILENVRPMKKAIAEIESYHVELRLPQTGMESLPVFQRTNQLLHDIKLLENVTQEQNELLRIVIKHTNECDEEIESLQEILSNHSAELSQEHMSPEQASSLAHVQGEIEGMEQRILSLNQKKEELLVDLKTTLLNLHQRLQQEQPDVEIEAMSAAASEEDEVAEQDISKWQLSRKGSMSFLPAVEEEAEDSSLKSENGEKKAEASVLSWSSLWKHDRDMEEDRASSSSGTIVQEVSKKISTCANDLTQGLAQDSLTEQDQEFSFRPTQTEEGATPPTKAADLGFSEEQEVLEDTVERPRPEPADVLHVCKTRVAELELWLQQANVAFEPETLNADMQQEVEQQLVGCQAMLTEIEHKVASLLENCKEQGLGDSGATQQEAEALSLKLKTVKCNLEKVQMMLQEKYGEDQHSAFQKKPSEPPKVLQPDSLSEFESIVTERPQFSRQKDFQQQILELKPVEQKDLIKFIELKTQKSSGSNEESNPENDDPDSALSSPDLSGKWKYLHQELTSKISPPLPQLVESQIATNTSTLPSVSVYNFRYPTTEELQVYITLLEDLRQEANGLQTQENMTEAYLNLDRKLFELFLTLSQYLGSVEEMLRTPELFREDVCAQQAPYETLALELKKLFFALSDRKDDLLKAMSWPGQTTTLFPDCVDHLQAYLEHTQATAASRSKSLKAGLDYKRSYQNEIKRLYDQLVKNKASLQQSLNEISGQNINEQLQKAEAHTVELQSAESRVAKLRDEGERLRLPYVLLQEVYKLEDVLDSMWGILRSRYTKLSSPFITESQQDALLQGMVELVNTGKEKLAHDVLEQTKSKSALQTEIQNHKLFFQKLVADVLLLQAYSNEMLPSFLQKRETLWAEQVREVEWLEERSHQCGIKLQSLLQKWETFDDNYASLEKDLEVLVSTLPSVSLVEETEERLVERISFYQQIKRNIDEKHARLYQTLNEGKQLSASVSCPELEGQIAKLEEQWLALNRRIDHELHRLQTLLKYLLSYNRDSDVLTKWLESSQQTLNYWKEQSLNVSQDLETIRNNINSFFEFSKELDDKSSLKTAVISTGNQLLHLKAADTAALRASLAQFEQKWTVLITQLPDIQEKLHQLQMEKLPSRKAITEMISWMNNVEHQTVGEDSEHSLSSASQVQSLLQKYKEFRMEMDYKQWIVDFVNQSLLQLSTCDVESKRYERTEFAEHLGEMNRQWQRVHGSLNNKIQHLEQLLENITENENKIQILNNWMEAQEERVKTLQKPESVISVQKMLLDCQDIENQLAIKSKALDELSQSYLASESGTIPLLEDTASKIEALFKKRSDVINQVNELKASTQSVLQEWKMYDKLYNEVNMTTIRFQYCMEHSKPVVLSLESLRRQVQTLQSLQDEAENSEGNWEKLQEVTRKLRGYCPSVAEIIKEKCQDTHTRWTQINQDVAEQLQKARGLLQLWTAYHSSQTGTVARLEQQEAKCQQLENINMSGNNLEEILTPALKEVKELQLEVHKTKEAFLQNSALLDRLPKSAESSTCLPLSDQHHPQQRASYLEKMLLMKANEFEFILSAFEDLGNQLESLKNLIMLEEENLNKLYQLQGKEESPDSLLNHVLTLAAQSPHIERLNEESLKLPLSDIAVKTLQSMNRQWIRATATALERFSELQGTELSEKFLSCCEKWVQFLEKTEETLKTNLAGSLPGLLEQQKAYEMLNAEVSVNQTVADSYVTQSLQLLGTTAIEKRPQFISNFTKLKDQWQSAAQGVRQRKSAIDELVRRWQYFTSAEKDLLHFLTNTSHLLSAVKSQDCYSHCQARSLIHKLKNKEIHFQRWQPTYALTLEAGEKLQNTSDMETKASVTMRMHHLQDSWKDTKLQVEEMIKQLQSTTETWDQCEKKIKELKNRLQILKAQSKEPLPEAHEDLHREKEMIKELEKALANWIQNLKELHTMKADLNQYILAEDVMILKEQIEHLHRQWEDLCLRVALRKQEIEDRLNSWIVFNEKNKELCAWLVQMENKVLQTADISIEEMIEKLQKDCMEEINLFSENKLQLKQMGDQLIKASNTARAAEIDDKLSKINDRWQHLFDVIGSRVKKLKETFAFIQQLDKNMSNLRTWLARIESELSKPVVYDVCDDQEIQKRLAEQQDLQRDIEQHSAGVESVFNICDVLLHDSDACANETECDSIQQTTRSLDRRWRNICAMSMERRMKIEETWRLWQKFLDDYSRFEDWLKSAERTAAYPNSSEVLYTSAKEELKRFEAFQRQIHERLTQLELINKQYRRLARENRTDTASRLKQMAHEGNQRWDNLQRRVAAILRRLRHFTNQREEFEGTRESILVWLTEMDLQLTNVEHFSESDADDKMRQLNGFQQEITLNTNKIDQLIVFGEQLIQKSEPLDAVLIEDELEELHRYCQEVFGRVSRFHQRLTSHAPGLEDDKEASENETDMEDPREIQTDSWRKRRESEPSSPQVLCHLVPPAPGPERSGCETPVSVDSIPLEWDHTGDVGGSSSHEDDEEGPFYSALSDVEILENPEAYLKMTTNTLKASSGKSISEGHSWHVPDSSSSPKHHYKQMGGERHGQPIPGDSSTPYKPGYVKLLLSPGTEGEKEEPSVLKGGPQKGEERPDSLTGQQSGAFGRWELIQAQELHDKLRLKQNLQQLNSDMGDVATWLKKTEAELQTLKAEEPPSNVQEMQLRVKRMQDILKAFDTYKTLMVSVRVNSKEFLQDESAESRELQDRVGQLSLHWDSAQGAVESWRESLRKSLMRCQDFHQLSQNLLLWLADAESRRQKAQVIEQNAEPQLLLKCQEELMQLEKELVGRQSQVDSLQEISSSLLIKGHGEDYIEAAEKVHVIEKKLQQLLEQVSRDLRSLQESQNPDLPPPDFDQIDSGDQGLAASLPAPQMKQFGAERTTKGKNQAESSRLPGPAGPSCSRPSRSFLSRVIRAAIPLQLLLLFLLFLACLLPSSEEDYSCTQANNFARSFYPMLRYTNGPPPT